MVLQDRDLSVGVNQIFLSLVICSHLYVVFEVSVSETRDMFVWRSFLPTTLGAIGPGIILGSLPRWWNHTSSDSS